MGTRMKRLIRPILVRLARALGIPDVQNRLNQLENPSPISQDLYLKLENRFRGATTLISERQSQYVPIVRDSISQKYPLLDLGCGRGEWLLLLSNHNLPARGIDSNNEAVALCQSQGLDVTQGNIISELRDVPSQSVGAITFFQVFEHLPFQILLDVLRDAKRALTLNGVLIVEIPNIETLRVGAATFWIDPTHHRPLFPDVLIFLALEAGFSTVESIFSTPLEDVPNLEGIDAASAAILKSLHQRINGNGDFAIIARP